MCCSFLSVLDFILWSRDRKAQNVLPTVRVGRVVAGCFLLFSFFPCYIPEHWAMTWLLPYAKTLLASTRQLGYSSPFTRRKCAALVFPKPSRSKIRGLGVSFDHEIQYCFVMPLIPKMLGGDRSKLLHACAVNRVRS